MSRAARGWQVLAPANAASSTAKKRHQIDALAAKTSSFFSLGFSQRGYCACAQVLTGLLLFRPATAVQPLHKPWCNRFELQPFTPRPQSSYARFISDVKTRSLGADFDIEWSNTTVQARAASQLSLNTRKARARARGNMVSVSKLRGSVRARPDQHIQRQEKAAWIAVHQAKLFKERRAEATKNLLSILKSGNSGNLLRGYEPSTSEPLSVAQVTRLNTQAWAVLKVYETIDLFQQRGEIPADGFRKGAATIVGNYFGYREKTVCGWLIDFESSSIFGHLRAASGSSVVLRYTSAASTESDSSLAAFHIHF